MPICSWIQTLTVVECDSHYATTVPQVGHAMFLFVLCHFLLVPIGSWIQTLIVVKCTTNYATAAGQVGHALFLFLSVIFFWCQSAAGFKPLQ